MTSLAHISAVLFNPVALAVVTSSLGLGASLLRHDVLTIQTPVAAESAVTESARTQTTTPSQWASVKPPRALTPAEQVLAHRFAEAMRAKPKAVRSVTLNPKSEPTEQSGRTWVCGVWEDLVQGRGQARTCEWR